MSQPQPQPEYRLIGTYTRYSSWTARVEAVLKYFKIPYMADYCVLSEVKNISHTGLVPLLEARSLGNDIRVSDSLAICEFLAESHQELALWPRDRQLRALARSAAAEMHSGFVNVRDLFGTNFLGRYTGNIPVPDAARKEIERIIAIWNSARQITKARLAFLGEPDEGFLFGKFSIADAFFWPVLWRFRSYNLPLDTASDDALRWMSKMWNDSTFQELGRDYYRQAESPKTVVDKYEDIFRDRKDVQYTRFPEDWTFTPPRQV